MNKVAVVETFRDPVTREEVTVFRDAVGRLERVQIGAGTGAPAEFNLTERQLSRIVAVARFVGTPQESVVLSAEHASALVIALGLVRQQFERDSGPPTGRSTYAIAGIDIRDLEKALQSKS